MDELTGPGVSSLIREVSFFSTIKILVRSREPIPRLIVI